MSSAGQTLFRLSMVLSVLLVSEPSAAQNADCALERVGGYTHSRRFDSLNYIHRASGGIDYRCSDGTRILADSAVVYEHSDQVQLFGSVRFQDPDTDLDADSARYYGNIGQLLAWSNVIVTDRRSGAVIRGDSLDFYRESRFRVMDRILVRGGNPHATVFPPPRPVAPVSAAHQEAVPDSAQGAQGEGADSAQAAQEEGADSAQTAPGASPADSLTATDAVVEAPAEPDAATASDDAPADSVVLPPYEIDANRFMIDGRQFFRAAGGVVVLRDSLTALGDSLDYDQDVGTMSILGEASLRDSGFELKAQSVEVTPTTGLSEEILARENAELVGSQVSMTAPAIRMFLHDGEVNRLVAISSIPPVAVQPFDTTGLSPGDIDRARALAESESAVDSLEVEEDSVARPLALADEFLLTADSIDVLSPDQLLDVVVAVGSARAETTAQDSLNTDDLPEFARQDWMEGDTIVAQFGSGEGGDGIAGGASIEGGDSIAARDSTGAAGGAAATGPPPQPGRSRLETLTAVGEAHSLYRMAAPDTTGAEPDSRPALHWVEGEQITIFLEEREVVKMEVEGQTLGYHLEPLPPDSVSDSTSVATDSTGVVPDSTGVPPDTVRARPDTTFTPRLIVRPRRGARR